MSLFNNSSCCGNTEGTASRKTKHSGCACEFFAALARRGTDFCSTGALPTQTYFRVIPKGSTSPLAVVSADDITLGGAGTVFTLLSFDPETGCVVLGYNTAGGAPVAGTPFPIDASILYDCRCLCGVVCVTPTPVG